MSGKAKVLSEDLKPILTASPVISKAITDMFGSVDPEKISGILQAAGRGPKEFIDDLVKKLSGLERVSGGPKNALENLSDSFTIAGYEAGKAADKAFGLTAKIDGLGSFVSSTATRFGELPPSLQLVTFGLVGTAAAIGPVALGLGSLLSLAPQFVRGFGGIGTALSAIVSPVGVVTIAIGAALGAFLVLGMAISHYDANLETSADQAKLFATTHDQVAASIGGETSRLSALLGIARDETISKKAREQAIKDINALSPQYLGNLSLETVNTAEATRAINQYTTALRLKAKVQTLNQQAAETEIALDRARAKSARDYVDNNRFSQDQIAINIKTSASFSPEADRAALFDQLGKDRKNAEVSRLADAGKLINEEIKKAYADAAKQNITVDPPKVKITDYTLYFNGTASGIKKAKDALKELGEEIASDKLKGLDVSAKTLQYNQLKEQIKSATAFTHEQKAAVEAVGSALTTNERISKRLNQEVKEQGDNTTDALKNQAGPIKALVDKGKGAIASLNKERVTTDIKPLQVGITAETIAPIVPLALGVTLDPVTVKNSNAQVRAIVGNFQSIAASASAVFSRTDAKAFLTPFQLAGPSLEAYQTKIEEIKATIATMTLNKVTVPAELIEQLKTLKQAVSDAFAGAGAADAQTDSGEKGDIKAKYVKKAQDIIASLKARGVEVKQSVEELAGSLQDAAESLKGKAAGILEAIGEGIGQGEDPLKVVLKTILGPWVTF